MFHVLRLSRLMVYKSIETALYHQSTEEHKSNRQKHRTRMSIINDDNRSDEKDQNTLERQERLLSQRLASLDRIKDIYCMIAITVLTLLFLSSFLALICQGWYWQTIYNTVRDANHIPTVIDHIRQVRGAQTIYFMSCMVLALFLAYAWMCNQWCHESSRVSVKGVDAVYQWTATSVLMLLISFLGLLFFYVAVYRNPYDMQMIKKVYTEGYMLLSPKNLIEIQTQYKCCGRNSYNETVCIDGMCESSAVIDHCVKQFYFKIVQNGGGCVPHLVASFLSGLIPSSSTWIPLVLYFAFIANNLLFLILFSAALYFVDFSLIEKKKAS